MIGDSGRMEIETAAKRLAEMGHPTRLAIIRHLVRSGRRGLPVMEIQRLLGVPQSTLSHHLARLMSAGLVNQTREGRILRCRAEYGVLKELGAFLLKDCCAGGVEPLSG